ncbi:MAG: type II secretion system F family protein [Pseudomonadota bacterium]
MRFRYVALEPDGREVRGEIDAASTRDALQKLSGEGRIPVSAARLDSAGGVGRRAARRSQSSLNAASLPDFTRRLSQMVGAGVPVERALETLSRSARDDAAARLQDQLKQGAALADALKSYGAPFTPVYVALVRAGEASGDLASALSSLAKTLERDRSTKDALISALIYPALLFAVSIAVFLLLILFVVPRFETLFADVGGDLPWATRAVLGAAAAIKTVWWAPLAFFVGGYGLFRWRGGDETFRAKVDGALLKLPAIGAAIVGVETTRLARALGALLSSGVPAHHAMRLANEAIANRALAAKAASALARVRRGERFSAAFAAEDLGDAELVEILAVGEASGDVGAALIGAASIFEENLTRRLKAMVSAIEPIIILTLGVLIGAVVVSLFAAILSVNDLAF